MNRHLDDKTVGLLTEALRRQDIPIARAANALGLSRSHLSQMLNGRQPMLRAYGLALRQYMTDIRKLRSEASQE